MKMVIDSHAHIGNLWVLNLNVRKVLWSMEQYGVDFSLVSSIESTEYYEKGKHLPWPLRKTTMCVCRKIVRAVKRHPDKLGALLWIQTGKRIPYKRLCRFIEKNRQYIYGIKIHPYRSEVAPDDPRTEPVYELARRFGLPVAAHTGDIEQAMTSHLYNAAKAHPDVRFIAVHMDLESGNQKAIEYISQLPNLYGDTTWVPVASALRAIERCGSEKILFGTDNPIDGKQHMLYNRAGQRSLCQEYFNEFKTMVSTEAYENVMYKNAERVFGISPDVVKGQAYYLIDSYTEA